MPASAELTAITEQRTEEFRDDLKRLNPEDRSSVAVALRDSYHLLLNNQRGFFARAKRPQAIHLKSGLSSSLYSLRAGRNVRLIVAVDKDPVFARTLVTLFRAVHQSDLDRAYRSVASGLYDSQMQRNGRFC